MTIKKTILTITILHDTAVSPPPSQCELEDIIREINDGDMIGSSHFSDSIEIPSDKVREELEAIGNDGTFFQDEDDTPACNCVEPGCPICDCDGMA